MIGDTELDDFFRKAGGLKSELANVVRALATPSLIYGEELTALRVRVKLLVGACAVDGVLAGQGKSDLRKAVSETLETLRTAKKADIPPVVPVLFHQTAALAAVARKKKVRETSPSPSISPLPVNRVQSTGDAAHPSLPLLAYVATVADPVATSARIAGRVAAGEVVAEEVRAGEAAPRGAPVHYRPCSRA